MDEDVRAPPYAVQMLSGSSVGEVGFWEVEVQAHDDALADGRVREEVRRVSSIHGQGIETL